jgi:fibronectin-binding autotransporter adhesin
MNRTLFRSLRSFVCFVALLGALVTVRAALNTTNNYIGPSNGDLFDAANWSLGHVPTVSEDAVFTADPGIRHLDASNLTVGSFNVTASTGTFSIRNETTTSTNSTLTLGGPGNLGNGVSGTAADLLYAATGSTFNIIGPNGSTGTGVLNLVLGQSGNFHAAGTIDISAAISDGGNGFGITKTGASTLTLSGTNTYSGTTTINGGTLVLGNATNTLADNNFVDIVTGTLSLGNNNDTVGNVTLEIGSITGTGGTLTSTNYDFRSGSVSANLAGTGTTLTKSSSGGLSLTGTNSYSGGTTINGGEVTFNNSSALGTGQISFGPNALDSMSLISTTAVLLSNNITINDLSPTPGRTATLGSFSTSSSGTNAYTGDITLSNTLNIKSSSPTSNPLTFSTGVISGTQGLIINPSGTLTPGAVKFAGNNTYAGDTSISAGTLLVTGGIVGSATNSATGTGNVTVSGTGTTLAGGSTDGSTGSILGTVNIGSNSKLSPGTSGTGSGDTAILHTGALTLSSGSTFTVNLNNTTAGSGYDQVISSGAITLSGSTLVVIVGGTLQMNDKFFILENSSLNPNTVGAFTNGATVTSGGYVFAINYADSGDGGLTLNDISLEVVAVPEPGTWIGGALAFVAVGYTQRKWLRKRLMVVGCLVSPELIARFFSPRSPRSQVVLGNAIAPKLCLEKVPLAADN